MTDTYPPAPHGDMQWRRANGTTGTYTGPLLDLGHGIPRDLPGWGIRRALFDIAFGYVSGFPIRDILAFSLRSVLPSRPLPIVLEPGWVILTCPSCDATMVGRPSDRLEHGDGGAHVYVVSYGDEQVRS